MSKRFLETIVAARQESLTRYIASKLQVDPPNDESVEKLLQSCEEHRNFFQRMFDVLIKLTAEVGQQSKDNLNLIQPLSDFTMGLQQETITLFSKIESVPTQSQLSVERHVDRAKKLHKWKRHHEMQFKGFEKLMSGLHQKTTGGEPNNRRRLVISNRLTFFYFNYLISHVNCI